jgi:hypothetical protein
MRIGIGTTGALATTDAASTTTLIPNMAYTFTNWWIFSDTTLCDYIHVVVKFNNGPMADVYGHFSFGEIDKGGLTYNSITYATCQGARGYAVTTASGQTSSLDWNSLNATRNPWSGAWGGADYGTAIISFMVHATTAPTPNGTAGWPAWDTVIYGGANLWGKNFRQSTTQTDPDNKGSNEFNSINSIGWVATPPAGSGTITLCHIPFLMINSTGSTGRLTWCGTFPNVRKCPLNGIAAEDLITYGSETWQVFPMLRNTADSVLNTSTQVTSGRAGIAFKKVI